MAATWRGQGGDSPDLGGRYGLYRRLSPILAVACLSLTACDPRDILNTIPPEGVSSVDCSCQFDHPRGPFGLSPTCDYLSCMCSGWADAECDEPLDENACRNHIADELDDCGAFRWLIDRPDPAGVPIDLLDTLCAGFYDAASGEACGFHYRGQAFCTGAELSGTENRNHCRQVCFDIGNYLAFMFSAVNPGYDCNSFSLYAWNAHSGRDKECQDTCEARPCHFGNLDTCTTVDIPTWGELEPDDPAHCSVGYQSPQPFCRVPDQDPPELNAGGIFANTRSRRSLGIVDATTSVGVFQSGELWFSSALSGTVSILGEPCIGCAASIRVDLDGSSVEYGDIPIDQIHLGGGTGTVPVIALNSNGQGVVLPGYFSGTLSMRVDGEPGYIAGHSSGTLNVFVDREDKTFGLLGYIILDLDDDNSLELSVNISGALENQPPMVDAGADVTLECASYEGTPTTLVGTAEDRDGIFDLRAMGWYEGPAFEGKGGGRLLVPWDKIDVVAPLGTTDYTFWAMDSRIQEATDTRLVTVADTTPPDIASFTYNGPACLWAPNHSYVVLRVGRDFSAVIEDVCDPDPQLVIVGAESSQPDNSVGDGNTTNDIVVGPDRVCLRSERQGGDASGREYTVHLAATDASGNENDPVVRVLVHHNESPPENCGMILDTVETVRDGAPECTPTPSYSPMGESRRDGTCAGGLPLPHAGLLALLLLGARGVARRRRRRA